MPSSVRTAPRRRPAPAAAAAAVSPLAMLTTDRRAGGRRPGPGGAAARRRPDRGTAGAAAVTAPARDRAATRLDRVGRSPRVSGGQVDAGGADDRRPDQVADLRVHRRAGDSVAPSTSGAWCAARPSSAVRRSTASTSTSTVSPTRSSARCAISSSASSVIRATRAVDHVRRAALPSYAGRLGAVLVGVAEDADRVQPGRGEEPLSSATSASVSPGKPTMTLDRDARPPAPAPGPGRAAPRNRSVSPNRRIRRSTGLAGVLEGQVEVGRDARRGGHRLDQRGPHLGRLQVGHPDPDDARRPRPAPAAAARAAAGRRGPCRTRWSSR